ncbi:MAG: hypothetical protein ACUZ8H_06200 [Candidatus Anammoxibacter sp.]
MTENEFKTNDNKTKTKSGNLALRDFHLFMPPEYDIKIKEGDDLDKLNLPKNLYQNLKTEKVMKGK